MCVVVETPYNSMQSARSDDCKSKGRLQRMDALEAHVVRRLPIFEHLGPLNRNKRIAFGTCIANNMHGVHEGLIQPHMICNAVGRFLAPLAVHLLPW